MTTGAAFGLLAMAHVARAVAEGAHLAREPFFVLTTIASLALCVWAFRLLATTRS